MKTNHSSIPIFSLFSGIGGFDLGAKIAGFNICAAIDIDENALRLYSSAIGSKTIQGRIEDINPKKVILNLGIKNNLGTILIGGPPCTGFSHAGFWIEKKRNGKDHQINRISDFLEYVKELRPIAFVIENVPGLLFQNYKSIFEKIINISKDTGYTISYKILNAAHYGIPQSRRRVFFVGIRGNHKFIFPKPTFSPERPRTTRWAIANIPIKNNPPESDENLQGKYSHLLPLIPLGDNYLYFTAHRGFPKPLFEWRTRYWSFLLKLHPDKPSPTIPAQRISNNGPFHWDNRRLRIREISRLQGFPDNYSIGTLPKSRVYLGNAVPPLLSAQLLWELRVQIGDAKQSEVPNALVKSLSYDISADKLSDIIGNFVVTDDGSRS